MAALLPSGVATELGRLLGSAVTVTGRPGAGESASTFYVLAAGGPLVVKVAPARPDTKVCLARLARIVEGLRAKGYPAPRILTTGVAEGTAFVVQERLAGRPVDPGGGCPPRSRELCEALPELLAAVDLQAGAGDLPSAPWPDWLLATIFDGGDGYCVLETMRASPERHALLRRLQAVAAAHARGPVLCDDIVHFDLSPANVLVHHGRLSGVIDWTVPFPEAAQGDRGFDLATLLFYAYDLPEARDALWPKLLEVSGGHWSRVYLCHLVLRQIEWTARHRPTGREADRFAGIAAAVLSDCER